MSSLASSCVLAVDKENSSEETGCNSGSVATCEHTSVRSLAARSLISLCLIEGNPPLGHDQLRKKICKHNEPGCEVGANHSTKQEHPGMQTCAKQSRILQGGE